MEQGSSNERAAPDQHGLPEDLAGDSQWDGQERRTAPREPKLKLDLTVNIPTMISLIVLVATTSASGFQMYYNLRQQQMATEYAVSNLTNRVEKAESAIGILKTEQVASTSSLRAEVKQDLAEIKGQLNDLIFGRRPQQAARSQLREWSR
jgi:hypothetical protein